jgi:hypothetical protein
MKNVWSLPLLSPFVVINWNISILLHSTLQTFFFGNSPTRARAASSLFLYHTQWHTTVCRTPLDGWSVRRRDLCLSSHKRRTSMTSVAFEPPNPSKRSTRRPSPDTTRPLETARYAASRLLVIVLVLGLGLAVVARSYVDGLASPDTSHASRWLVGLRLLSVHQREARKPVKDGDTCSSDDSQCWQHKHGVDEWGDASGN